VEHKLLDLRFRSGDCEEYRFLGCNIMYFGDGPTFRRNISSPCSWPKSRPRKKTADRAQLASLLLLVSCFVYSSTLKMKAICSSETSRSILATWHRNSKECTLNTNSFIEIRYIVRSLFLQANNFTHAQKPFSRWTLLVENSVNFNGELSFVSSSFTPPSLFTLSRSHINLVPFFLRLSEGIVSNIEVPLCKYMKSTMAWKQYWHTDIHSH
jgi:hypothetical protein